MRPGKLTIGFGIVHKSAEHNQVFGAAYFVRRILGAVSGRENGFRCQQVFNPYVSGPEDEGTFAGQFLSAVVGIAQFGFQTLGIDAFGQGDTDGAQGGRGGHAQIQFVAAGAADAQLARADCRLSGQFAARNAQLCRCQADILRQIELHDGHQASHLNGLLRRLGIQNLSLYAFSVIDLRVGNVQTDVRRSRFRAYDCRSRVYGRVIFGRKEVGSVGAEDISGFEGEDGVGLAVHHEYLVSFFPGIFPACRIQCGFGAGGILDAEFQLSEVIGFQLLFLTSLEKEGAQQQEGCQSLSSHTVSPLGK